MNRKIVIMALALIMVAICAGFCIGSIATGRAFWAVANAVLVAVNLNTALSMWRLL